MHTMNHTEEFGTIPIEKPLSSASYGIKYKIYPSGGMSYDQLIETSISETVTLHHATIDRLCEACDDMIMSTYGHLAILYKISSTWFLHDVGYYKNDYDMFPQTDMDVEYSQIEICLDFNVYCDKRYTKNYLKLRDPTSFAMASDSLLFNSHLRKILNFNEIDV